MNAVDIARDIIRRGYKPVPVPFGAKGPEGREAVGWPNKNYATDLLHHFGRRKLNCGCQFGACSKNLSDTDLDCKEAIALAPYFLPRTNSVYGRPSKPRSHFLYTCADVPPNRAAYQFFDENEAMILEMRFGGGIVGEQKGAQSIWPGSTHKSGEVYEWSEDGEPANIAFADWHLAVQKVAAATIIARHWPPLGGRHDAALVLGGFLARLGWNEDAVEHFVIAAATVGGSDDPQAKGRPARDAVKNFTARGNTFGLPQMCETFGEKPALKIKKILGYHKEAPSPTPTDNQPTIMVVGGSLSANADEAERVLINADIQFYERSNYLVRPIVKEAETFHGGKTKTAQLTPVSVAYMRDIVGRVAHWIRFDARAQEWVPTNPPEDVAKTVLARSGEWAFPSIAGVLTTPTLRPDGTVLDRPGFDPATRLLLVDPPPMEPIPERPTKDDADKALELLKGLLVEFMFADDGGISRAVALSAMITPVARGAYPLAPMHTTDATAAGSGKSYLLDIVAMIATGQKMPVISMGGKVEETEKRLGSALLAGHQLVCIDNVSTALFGDCLCQIIERPRPQVRILGKSQLIEVETRGVSFYSNGNNLQISGDLCRRVIRSRLDTRMENPEQRVYKLDPVAMIAADRGAYIRAALIICRAYIAEGRPNAVARLGSFGAWSDTVRSALMWLGEADPVLSMTSIKGDDPTKVSFRDLLDAWVHQFGTGEANAKTVKDVVETACAETGGGMYERPTLANPDFFNALQDAVVGSDRRRKLDATSVGYWLRARRGTVVGKYCFQHTETSGIRSWFVEEIGTAMAADGTASATSGNGATNTASAISTSWTNGPWEGIAEGDWDALMRKDAGMGLRGR